MAEMVFLQSEQGSKAVRVACPECGRISLQILKRPYDGAERCDLASTLTCPVCGKVYQSCSAARTAEWSAAFGRFTQNSSAYNSAAKDNYTRQQSMESAEPQDAGMPISHWQDLFTVTILKRGETYARRGAVSGVVANDKLITASVSGTEEYKVKINLNGQSITGMECSCPYAKVGETCKHMAAALYVAVNGVVPDLPQRETPASPDSEEVARGQATQSLISALEKRIEEQIEEGHEEAPKPIDAAPVPKEELSSQPTTPFVQPETSTNVSGFGEAVSLERKLTRWKKELLDTGKRNKMINYRETSRSTLKILEPGLEELFNKLAIGEKEMTFQKPINKDSDYRTYAMLALLETLSYTLPVHVGDIKAEGTIVEREKTLKNLRAKTKLAREEQGTNILYLSFGFILWRETDRPSAQWMKAPLLMMPVSLEMKSLNAPYTISRYDDDIEVNPTLDYLFNAEYGIDLPTFELKDKQSITEYLDTIEEIIDRRGWKLVREVSLGLLSFQKINMYHDLNNDYNQQIISRHPVLRAMGGDYAAIKGLPSDIQNFDFDAVEPKDWHQVINADSSQQEAILLSKRGVSFVMQGPPGTGKSQTITNIIAEALADGKKILFVSEKAAALQVVLKRLTEVGLSDFCLSLHDYKANKKVIIDNIGANLSLESKRLSRTAMADLTELLHSREALNEYAKALHSPIMPFDGSIYAAYGRITQLESAPTVDFSIDNPLSVSKETFSDMLYNVEMFERALHAMGEPLHENPWYKTTATSSGQAFKMQITGKTKNLSSVLPTMEKTVAELNAQYGTNISCTWRGVQDGVAEVKAILDLPEFPIEWTDASKAAFLLESARKALEEQQVYHSKAEQIKDEYLAKAREAKQHQAKLKRQVEVLNKSWDETALKLDVDDIKARYGEVYSGETDTIENCIRRSSAASEKCLDELRKVLRYNAEGYNLLRISEDGSINGVSFIDRIISILVNAPYMETAWFDPRKNAEVMPLIEEACRHSEAVNSKTEKLLGEWESGILTIDVAGMLARFKVEYTGLLHKLKGTYKDDIKALKLMSKTVGAQITEETAIAVLQEVEAINEEKAWFDKNKDRLIEVFNRQYKGTETDWEKLRYGVTSALTIAGMFPYSNIPTKTVSAIQDAIENSEKAAKVRELHDELTVSRLAELKAGIGELSYIAGFSEEEPLAEKIVPQIEKFLEECNEQKNYLGAIQSCFLENGTDITYEDISGLIDMVSLIRSEKSWLGENEEQLKSLYADSYSGEETDWDAIIAEAKAGQAQQFKELVSAMERSSGPLSEQFGLRYSGIDTDWEKIIEEIELVQNAFAARNGGASFSDQLIGLICDSQENRTKLNQTMGDLDSLIEQVRPEMQAFFALFEDGNDYDLWALQGIVDKYEKCMAGFDKLDQWIDYVETKRECDKLGLSSFTAQIEKEDNTVADVKDAFEKGFYNQWIIPALEQAPEVQGFRRRVHEQRLEKFTALDEEQFSIARDRIRSKIISTFPDPYGVSGPRSEIGILRHEMEKKRRIMPLRKLFRTIPNLLLTLKPCLMMSPLSVAYFLEAESYHFDMVIFDEASQIFPQDAIGAILRADQVIIAGDTKQLPPTNFFTTSTGNGTDDYDLDEDGEWEDELYDSILEETANILPNRTLLWHYRSKSEHLIAFSNQEIYQNELVTFPSINETADDSGVEFVYVEEGYYEGGGKNCNVLEAKRCVELVISHIEHHPDRSLGIIAFSEKQQQAISREIQLFREQNPKYEEFFQEGKEEEFFVKNLENVQGDERDTIIFSVGYAKTKDQKAKGKPMAMRFGPLGVQGGERRLNVAITRAKQNVKLVSSILPSDIDLSRTESEGIRMLHDYIAFAMNTEGSLAGAQRAAAVDEFKTSVAEFLRQNGYSIRESVGCSGYKIDIAVKHPSQREEYVAGIECDGISYISARTARDRDRLRRSVLTAMGWQMYRVWSTEWYKNPEIEGQKLISFVKEAIAVVDERIRQEEAQKNLEAERRKAEQEKIRIAKEKAEQDRRMEEQRRQEDDLKRLEAAKQAAEDRRKRAEAQRAHEARRIDESPKSPHRETAEIEKMQKPSDLSWVKSGARAVHTSFGSGVIRSVSRQEVRVAFGKKEMVFQFPDVVLTGKLRQREQQEEIDRTEQQRMAIERYPWIAKGSRVRHGSYGVGEITSISNGLITITFSTGERKFEIPKAIDSGAIVHEAGKEPKAMSGTTGGDSAILSKLNAAGFSCIDKRSSSSILWVLYSSEKKEEFEKIVSGFGVQYALERRGAVATENKPAWRIMF